MVKKMTVIDFFCGAGGFSEGFRQQGFKVVQGIDNWEPAIRTHNLNHNLNDKTFDISLFWGKDSNDTEFIDKLPDTDVIVGSPPCVSFSMSNKAGKADKTLGIRLIETYLRVVAVKKGKKKSSLKAWLLENVPNSKNYLKESYTYSDLNLRKWALSNGLSPKDVVFEIKGDILISSDYGAPQHRKRYVCGENVETGEFPLPVKMAQPDKTIAYILKNMPAPLEKSSKKLTDPNYPGLKIAANDLTDQHYDTGLYVSEWERSKDLKTHHPFMGKMSFPENTSKPLRTITATRSASTRESLIFPSEVKRKGNGEYRLPTIREVATFMGYPFTYQFAGSEGTKWKLIGNSVSPQLSAALASEILRQYGLKSKEAAEYDFVIRNGHDNPTNLNDWLELEFKKPKARTMDAKFRRVLVKERNITIELLNYHPEKARVNIGREWYLCAFHGTGVGYRLLMLDEIDLHDFFKESKLSLHNTVKSLVPTLKRLAENKPILQELYVRDMGVADLRNPINIVAELRDKIACMSMPDIVDRHVDFFDSKIIGPKIATIFHAYAGAERSLAGKDVSRPTPLNAPPVV